MMVKLKYRGQTREVEISSSIPVSELLAKAGINPETVIVRKGDEIVPDTEKLKDRDQVEAINVVSGG